MNRTKLFRLNFIDPTQTPLIFEIYDGKKFLSLAVVCVYKYYTVISSLIARVINTTEYPVGAKTVECTGDNRKLKCLLTSLSDHIGQPLISSTVQ